MTKSRIHSSSLDMHGETTMHNVCWRGHSGRLYELHTETSADFALKDHNLYVIVENGAALWIGTAGDIIDDERSRAGFRSSLKSASMVLSLPAPDDLVARMTLKWDLEGGIQMSDFHLAGAA